MKYRRPDDHRLPATASNANPAPRREAPVSADDPAREEEFEGSAQEEEFEDSTQDGEPEDSVLPEEPAKSTEHQTEHPNN